MKCLFLLLLVSHTCHAFWNDAKEAAEKAADIEIITDAITDLSEAVSDEKELSNHLNSVKKSSADVRGTLRDLNYTHEEIDDLLKGDELAIEDLSGTISRTARRIKRAKNLGQKIGLLTAGSPEAVTAVQSLEMNQTLREIHSELAHQRMDRQIEKDKQRAEILEKRVAEKKKEAFFKKQFALMEKSSRIGTVSYFPFKDNGKTESKDSRNSIFSWVL